MIAVAHGGMQQETRTRQMFSLCTLFPFTCPLNRVSYPHLKDTAAYNTTSDSWINHVVCITLTDDEMLENGLKLYIFLYLKST